MIAPKAESVSGETRNPASRSSLGGAERLLRETKLKRGSQPSWRLLGAALPGHVLPFGVSFFSLYFLI